MNAYLWFVDEARERIGATRGDEIARRAVIMSLQTARADQFDSAAACA